MKFVNWKSLLTTILLGVIAFVSYYSSISYDFLNYDDQRVLTEHPELYNQPNAIASLKAIVLENYPREEPLLVRDLSWALDSRIFGFRNPMGAHLGNVMLHSAVIMLFFVFILLATRKYKIALIASILALALAVHVEPVVWVMGRKDVLVACFGLLAMISTILIIDSKKIFSKSIYYFLTFVFVLLSLFSKISALVFPIVLMVLAVLRPYLCGDRLPNDTIPWKRILFVFMFLPHLLMSFVVYQWYSGILTEYGIMDRGYTAAPLQHLLNLLTINPLVLCRYLSNIVMPMKLSLFYSWPSLSANFAWYHIGLSVLTILGCVCLSVWMFLKRKDLLCYFLVFWILMIPYLNILYFGIWTANRYIYFSSLFLMAMVATAVISIWESKSHLLRGFIIFLLAAFCIFNILGKFNYMKVWKNNETLWMYEVKLPNPRPEPFENLAHYYYTRGMQTQDMELREIYFSNVESIIENARYALGKSTQNKPSSVMYDLLFIDALMSVVNQDTYETQLEKLLIVKELKPDFDAVLWQLTILYYKQALQFNDEVSEKKLVDKSISCYKQYLNVTQNDAALRKKDKSVRAEFISDFPFAKEQIEALDKEN